MSTIITTHEIGHNFGSPVSYNVHYNNHLFHYVLYTVSMTQRVSVPLVGHRVITSCMHQLLMGHCQTTNRYSMSVCLYVCLSVCMYVCMSVCQGHIICMYVNLSVNLLLMITILFHVSSLVVVSDSWDKPLERRVTAFNEVSN